jgi:hypothetical protein
MVDLFLGPKCGIQDCGPTGQWLSTRAPAGFLAALSSTRRGYGDLCFGGGRRRLRCLDGLAVVEIQHAAILAT